MVAQILTSWKEENPLVRLSSPREAARRLLLKREREREGEGCLHDLLVEGLTRQRW